MRSHKDLSFAAAGVHVRDLAALGIGPDGKVFARDCLQVELDFGDRSLALFGCHFKSMNNGRDDGRVATLPVRRAEARAVKGLIRQRFGAGWREAAPPASLFAWGIVPPLVAWAAVMMPASAGLVIHGAMLWLCYAVDRRVYPRHGAGAWLVLRFRLSAVAGLACFIGAAGT